MVSSDQEDRRAHATDYYVNVMSTGSAVAVLVAEEETMDVAWSAPRGFTLAL